MVKLNNYSAYNGFHGVVRRVNPPTTIRKTFSGLFCVIKDFTVPFQKLLVHCKLKDAHSTYSADILKEEDPRRILCSAQPALQSSQSAYRMLRNSVIVQVIVCTCEVQEGR